MTRTRERSTERATTTSDGTADEAFLSELGQSDAAVSLGDVLEGQPWGGGVEEVVPAGETSTLIEWSVPVSRKAEIDRCSVSIPEGATGTVFLAGLRYGPYSGPHELAVVFDGAALIGGSLIRVVATADAAAEQTIQAQLTGRLY